jgi:hypothetical protein
MFVLFEELKERTTLPRIHAPAFHDDEPRDAKTEAVEVGNLSSLRKSFCGPIQRLISRRSRIRNATRTEITFQLLMKTEVEATCFIRIVRTKKRQ